MRQRKLSGYGGRHLPKFGTMNGSNSSKINLLLNLIIFYFTILTLYGFKKLTPN